MESMNIGLSSEVTRHRCDWFETGGALQLSYVMSLRRDNEEIARKIQDNDC